MTVPFNLFPGMGAYSFLSRRIGRIKAERMILSGRIHSADELHAMGLVDVVAPEGEAALRLGAQDLRRIARLIGAQDRRRG